LTEFDLSKIDITSHHAKIDHSLKFLYSFPKPG